MAFLQSEFPPSTAPVHPRRPADTRAATRPASHRRATSTFVSRLVAGLAAAGIFAIPGYLAASATESLVIGILATDFTFLLAVAGWSAVAGSARR